jgi:intracellular septation protein A
VWAGFIWQWTGLRVGFCGHSNEHWVLYKVFRTSKYTVLYYLLKMDAIACSYQKQDRQYTYHVTMKRVLVTPAVVEKQ